MTNRNDTAKGHSLEGGSTMAMGAGILIVAGLALQWFELVCLRFVGQNAWFFSTLFGGVWNLIDVWLRSAPWHEDLQYWPLLLVATGIALWPSRSQKPQPVRVQFRSGARRDA